MRQLDENHRPERLIMRRLMEMKADAKPPEKLYYFGRAINQRDLPFQILAVREYRLSPFMEASDNSRKTTPLEEVVAGSLDELCPKLLTLQKRTYHGGDLSGKGWLRKGSFSAYSVGQDKAMPIGELSPINLQRLIIYATSLELLGEEADTDVVQLAFEQMLHTGESMMYGGHNSAWSKEMIAVSNAMSYALELVYDAPGIHHPYDGAFCDPRGMVDLFDFAEWYVAYFLPDKERPNKLPFSDEVKTLVNERFIAAAMLPIH